MKSKKGTSSELPSEDEPLVRWFVQQLGKPPDDEPEIPEGQKDLYNALTLADGFQASKQDNGYVLEEGWDIRDTIHAVVTLARAFRAERTRNKSQKEPAVLLDIQPIDSMVVDEEPVLKPAKIILENRPGIVGRKKELLVDRERFIML